MSNLWFKRPKDAMLAPLVRDNPRVTATRREAVIPSAPISILWSHPLGGTTSTRQTTIETALITQNKNNIIR